MMLAKQINADQNILKRTEWSTVQLDNTHVNNKSVLDALKAGIVSNQLFGILILGGNPS